MKIRKNEIEFTTGKSIKLSTTNGQYRMDYIISMLSDQISSTLKHMNRKELWLDDPSALHVNIMFEDGTTNTLSVLNIKEDIIQVLIGSEVMEEANELEFATSFLRNIQSDMNQLLSDYSNQKYIYSQLKSDLRNDLNHLELLIDQYGLDAHE